MSVAILLLAGGASSRMGGRDKLVEEVDGAPLLRRMAERALMVSDDVTVAIRPGFPARRAALEGLPVAIHEPEEALEGMGGTIRAGVSALRDRAAILLVLSDLPELTAADLRAVIAARDAHPEAAIWRGATGDGAPGHPILFAPETFPDLMALTGDDGGKPVIAKHRDRLHLVPLPGDHARADLDTPEDWSRWRAART